MTTLTPTLSATGRESIVLTVGPASADQFVHLVETFGEATRSACRSLVLDLSDVDRIDSDLLGLLLWAHGRLRQRGAELVLACPSPATRSLLGKSGLDHVLSVRDQLPVAA
jgi:anti-anti-sigma factor